MHRYFLVACPRSGSTLLQAMLAQHPQVFSFPETHYLQKIAGRLRDQHFVVSPRAAARTLDHLATLLNSERPRLPRWWLGTRRYVDAFIELTDEAARRAGCSVWVEKSPVHLRYIDTISRLVPQARFIHMLRDGRDVVASLVEAYRRDPERWLSQLVKGVPTPEWETLYRSAAQRWNSDLGLSLAHLGKENHCAVLYEELVAAPQSTLATLCGFMNLLYDNRMERHWEAAGSVVGWRVGMPHMARVMGELEDRRGVLFADIFDEKEQLTISELLAFGGDLRTAL